MGFGLCWVGGRRWVRKMVLYGRPWENRLLSSCGKRVTTTPIWTPFRTIIQNSYFRVFSGALRSVARLQSLKMRSIKGSFDASRKTMVELEVMLDWSGDPFPNILTIVGIPFTGLQL